MSRESKSRDWMRQHVNDPYVKQAQAQGYRSRAAFKLIELAQKDGLIAPGFTVVDLGATPGSWSQVLAKAVGPSGKVVAVDILDMEPLKGVQFIQGDFREDGVLADIEKALVGRPVDLVVSDMSPNLSGVASADQARSIYLCELALDFACKHLTKNGNFLVKVFQGAGFPEFHVAMRAAFTKVNARKPQASRDRSVEFYLVGKHLKQAAKP